MKAFSDLTAISQMDNFLECPNDWSVIISDVKNSTTAVEQGLFREVNISGASMIALFNEGLQTRDFPYIFGGDGSTILLPTHLLENFKTQLAHLIFKIRKDFKLNLRIGLVKYSDVQSLGGQIFIGKLKLSDGNALAQLTGNGLLMAEKMIKVEDKYLLEENQSMDFQYLSKLSCRFAPMASKNGQILTLTVAPIVALDDSRFIQFMQELKPFLVSERNRPVDQIYMDSFFKIFQREVKINSFRWRLLFELIFIWSIERLFKYFSFGTLRQSVQGYLSEIPKNSDYQKYDGYLRAVLDCTLNESKQVVDMLEFAEKLDLIKFGLNFSDSAVATCIVDDIKNDKHIHFIDGKGGGYTAAATILKSKLKKVNF